MTALITSFVVSIVGWLLAPIYVDFIADSDLSNVNYTGTNEDFSWAGKLAIVFYYMAISLLPAATLFFVIKSVSKN